MTYPDWKKKVRSELENAPGVAYNETTMQFYEKAFDNLLVEVEGNCVPLRVEPSEDVSQQFRTGWNRCLEALAMGFTRFKGEDGSGGGKLHDSFCKGVHVDGNCVVASLKGEEK